MSANSTRLMTHINFTFFEKLLLFNHFLHSNQSHCTKSVLQRSAVLSNCLFYLASSLGISTSLLSETVDTSQFFSNSAELDSDCLLLHYSAPAPPALMTSHSTRTIIPRSHWSSRTGRAPIGPFKSRVTHHSSRRGERGKGVELAWHYLNEVISVTKDVVINNWCPQLLMRRCDIFSRW